MTRTVETSLIWHYTRTDLSNVLIDLRHGLHQTNNGTAFTGTNNLNMTGGFEKNYSTEPKEAQKQSLCGR